MPLYSHFYALNVETNNNYKWYFDEKQNYVTNGYYKNEANDNVPTHTNIAQTKKKKTEQKEKKKIYKLGNDSDPWLISYGLKTININFYINVSFL